MRRLFYLSAVLVVLIGATCSTQKKEQYDIASVCERAKRCDPQVQAHKNGLQICLKSMKLLEEKYPDKVVVMNRCLANTPCSELSLGSCMTEMAHSLKAR